MNIKSDARIKENIIDLPDPLAKLNALLPRQFNLIDDPTIIQAGFIAQEYYEVFPDFTLANGHNGTDPLGNRQPWEITTDVLIPYLVASIKVLSARIEALENNP